MLKLTKQELVAALEYAARSLGASDSDIYEFTRCVRPDGTAYGTRGKCRKGTEAKKEEAPKETPSERKTGGEFVGSSDLITGGGEREKLRQQLKELKKRKKDHPEDAKLVGDKIKETSKELNTLAANKKILDRFTLNSPSGTRVAVTDDGVLRADITTKSGHTVTTFFGKKNFDFMVNGSYDAGTVKNRREQVEVAFTVRRVYEALVKALPEGAVVTTSAWTQDGKGRDRMDAYLKMGFSRPVRLKYGKWVEGEPGDTQYSIKKGNGMVPSNRSEKESDSTYNFSEGVLAVKLWHTAIFGKDDKGPASSSPSQGELLKYTEVLDYTRCQRSNGTFYGTRGKCLKGTEREKTYPYKAAVTQGRFNIPHKGHAKLIKHLLEKAPVAYVIMGGGEKNVDKDFRSQMLRAVLRQEGVDLSRVKMLKGDRAASVISKLGEEHGKENVVFALGADQDKFLKSMQKSLGMATDIVPRDDSGASSSAIRRMIDSGDDSALSKEFDGNPYLTRLAQIARRVEQSDFAEIEGSWEFTRCQRKDGSFYGTRGNCRKGSEAGPKEKKKQEGDFLGGGLEGKVYDIGRNRALKVSASAQPNSEAQTIASEAGLAPRMLASGAIKGDAKGRRFQIFDKVDAEGIPGIGQPGRPSKSLEESSPEELRREKQAYLAALDLNSRGVAHGDLHGGNLRWDKTNDRPVIMDFDSAVVNDRQAKKEGKALLNSIGIRLEEAGLYDEADQMYRLASGSRKTFFDDAQAAIRDFFPEEVV